MRKLHNRGVTSVPCEPAPWFQVNNYTVITEFIHADTVRPSLLHKLGCAILSIHLHVQLLYTDHQKVLFFLDAVAFRIL